MSCVIALVALTALVLPPGGAPVLPGGAQLLPPRLLLPHAAARRATPACVAAATDDLEALGVAGLPLEKTVRGFQMVPDQKLRYQQLLFLAKKLPDMEAALQVEANRVPG